MSQPIILASSSRYRAELLCRLGLEFDTLAPELDETQRPEESAKSLVMRLAAEKAAKVAHLHPHAIVIGSDQVAISNGETLGKPGTAERAAQQLADASGGTVTFYTAVSVVQLAADKESHFIDQTTVYFRTLSTAEIERYIAADQPLDCAGSFKVESLGASLFEKMECADPTALVGLPLIQLSHALRKFGVQLP
ncbi:MAG: Maf family nucleotide pyrophosphatase [Gammaproteobacteria bacterium]|nr:Maf family nucleotide pyrophosphatase [Gammaproteobacteria bacterium]